MLRVGAETFTAHPSRLQFTSCIGNLVLESGSYMYSRPIAGKRGHRPASEDTLLCLTLPLLTCNSMFIVYTLAFHFLFTL